MAKKSKPIKLTLIKAIIVLRVSGLALELISEEAQKKAKGRLIESLATQLALKYGDDNAKQKANKKFKRVIEATSDYKSYLDYMGASWGKDIFPYSLDTVKRAAEVVSESKKVKGSYKKKAKALLAALEGLFLEPD